MKKVFDEHSYEERLGGEYGSPRYPLGRRTKRLEDDPMTQRPKKWMCFCGKVAS